MAYFQTKNPNFGNFWRDFGGMLVSVMAIWSILRPFGLVCGYLVYLFYGYLVYFLPVLVCCTKKNLATVVPCHLADSEAGRQVNNYHPFLFSPSISSTLS
jgi:hypothetical protein